MLDGFVNPFTYGYSDPPDDPKSAFTLSTPVFLILGVALVLTVYRLRK